MKRNLLSIVTDGPFLFAWKGIYPEKSTTGSTWVLVSSCLAREYFAPIQVKNKVFRAMEIILHLYFLSCEDRLKLSSCDGKNIFSSTPPVIISKLLTKYVVY